LQSGGYWSRIHLAVTSALRPIPKRLADSHGALLSQQLATDRIANNETAMTDLDLAQKLIDNTVSNRPDQISAGKFHFGARQKDKP
jgi:hypothetical protein